jgi:hypothetical protein
MDVVADVRKQRRFTQLLKPKIIDESRKSELSLVEGASPYREDTACTTDTADPRMMCGSGAHANGHRTEQGRRELKVVSHLRVLYLYNFLRFYVPTFDSRPAGR